MHRISQALTDAGLTTLPDFAVCGQRSDVDVVPLAFVPAQAAPSDTDEETVETVHPNKKAEHRTGQVSGLMFGDRLKLLDGDQTGTSLAEAADANGEASDPTCPGNSSSAA